MQDNSFLPHHNDDDVCNSNNEIFKVGKLREALKEAFNNNLQTALNDVLKSKGFQFSRKFYNSIRWCISEKGWLDDGMDCEILKIGAKGWQKGKIRIRVSVEFIPDEPEIEQTPEITQPESPLDDIRRKINEATA